MKASVVLHHPSAIVRIEIEMVVIKVVKITS